MEAKVRVAGTRTEVGGRMRTEATAVVAVAELIGIRERTGHRLGWLCASPTPTALLTDKLPTLAGLFLTDKRIRTVTVFPNLRPNSCLSN